MACRAPTRHSAPQPHLPLSYLFSGTVQEYQVVAEARELPAPHPAACPHCGQSRGWTRYDRYWRQSGGLGAYLLFDTVAPRVTRGRTVGMTGRRSRELAEFTAVYDVSLRTYCLMPNHFQLCLVTRQATLSAFMQALLAAFTVSTNRREGQCGHLFQGRFKAMVIEAASWGMAVSRYIALNPVRTEFWRQQPVAARRRHWRDCPWSSCGALIGQCPLSWRTDPHRAERVRGVVFGRIDVGGTHVPGAPPVLPRATSTRRGSHNTVDCCSAQIRGATPIETQSIHGWSVCCAGPTRGHEGTPP